MLAAFKAEARKQFPMHANWSELEQGIHSNAESFVDHLWAESQEGDIAHGATYLSLIDLDGFLESVSEAIDRLRDEPGRGEDLELAVLVQRHLTETEEGKRWLAQAQAAANALLHG